MLVLTPLGVQVNGQKAWLRIVGLQFQPSEFVKIPTVLMLAKYFGGKKATVLTFKEMLIGGLFCRPRGFDPTRTGCGSGDHVFSDPCRDVLPFRDQGQIRGAGNCRRCDPCARGLYRRCKIRQDKKYQQERINAIIDPDSVDPRGYGYHTIQSTITVGKGGLSGIKGETETSQSVLKFLPEPQTDFIFAVTAENTGFIGCVSLLLAYALLLSRMIAGARQSSDRAGMLVIMSIVCGMVFQIFMNVGMALGCLPVIGVPLPLMSAGLSAIFSTFVAIGFVVSVKLRRFVN
ncbi:MAG: FtsW/RodA/SpoVE family cell cycle protein [Chloracidobacterium sp.]|nr:FtsW/RodA/SpoVE family cell cycle protein [Chloracidobacterium sp.]